MDVFRIPDECGFSPNYYNNVSDINGEPLSIMDIEGLKDYAGGEIVQRQEQIYISASENYPDTDDIRFISGWDIDTKGEISGACVYQRCDYYVIKKGSEYTSFKLWHDDYPEDFAPAYPVTYVNTKGEELKHYYARKDSPLAIIKDDNQYSYSFKLEDGTAVSSSTPVTEPMTVIVTTTEKPAYTINVDGVSKSLFYGQKLSECGIDSYVVDKDAHTILDKDYTVTDNMNLKTISLSGEKREDNKLWFALEDADDVQEFAQIVNNEEILNINGYLKNDVTLDNSFDMIGNLEAEYYPVEDQIREVTKNIGFRGQFDGNNKTVTLSIDKPEERMVGLFRCVGSGATIKNLTVKGSVKGKTYVGGLVATVYFSSGASSNIINCVNEAEVISNSSYPGGICAFQISDIYYPRTELVILNCGNTGLIKSEANTSCAGIITYGTAVDIANCYNMADCILSDERYNVNRRNCYNRNDNPSSADEKALKSFTSGEVAYLINKAAGDNIWYQTCGEGHPILNGNASTQTVYAGYADCEATELSYANVKFEKTVPGHVLTNELTDYADGVISAKCKECNESFEAHASNFEEHTENGLEGIKIEYSQEWTDSNLPDITVEYSGSATLPAQAGTYEARFHIGDWSVGQETYKVHTYGDWIPNGDGTHTRTCVETGCTECESGDCQGGNSTCTSYAICELCGGEYGQLRGEHVMGKWKSNHNGTHTRKCTIEGCSFSETDDCKGTEATCAHKSVCKTCGEEFGELVKTHSFGSWVKKSDGTEVRKCTVKDCKAREIRETQNHKKDVQISKGVGVKNDGKKVKISWGRVKEADGYEVYIRYRIGDFSKKPTLIVKGNKKTSTTITKIGNKKINNNKDFKFIVKAFKYDKDKKRVTIAESLEFHIAGSDRKNLTNAKAVKVKSSNVKLKVGKSSTIKATIVKVNPKKKVLSDGQVKNFRYVSSSPLVATVNSKGKITATGVGKTTIYVYAANGKFATVKVTVK